MRKIIGFILFPAFIIFLLISCSPSKSLLAIYLYGTQSAWTIHPTFTYYPTYTIQPTFTYYPTYTFQPTTIKEITRLVIVTETNTPTLIFSLTKTPTKTLPIILTTGYGILEAYRNQDGGPLSYFDLDLGKNVNDKTSDIEFSVSCGSACFPFVGPVNGAISFIFGRREPSYEDCLENMVSESYQISDLYICVMTNSQNISVIKIGFPIQREKGSWKLAFYYKTWRHPED